jgi:hypothetical protein
MAQPVLHTIYVKEAPPVEEIEQYSLPQLQGFVAHFEDDVALLAEESHMFQGYLQALKERDQSAAAVKLDDDEAADAHRPEQPAGGGKRRGRAYRRKSSETKHMFLTVDEKNTIAAAEAERFKGEKDRGDRVVDDARDLFRATLEEAHNRIKEVKMELAFFKREVTTEGDEPSAEKILRYMADRPLEQQRHVAKTKEKVAQTQQQISKFMLQLRQREDIGEAFHEIDFSQLQIENHQFIERIDQKNAELVDLKGTTTRTVQTLNNLTDRLNVLTSEQQQLRKELKMRQEHVDKLTAEIEQVKRDGGAAQKKNTALKIQHESVKVPKVEDYIAQKAETYELQKAVQNWQRKVEIANGHVAVMKQQMLSLKKKMGMSVTKSMR